MLSETPNPYIQARDIFAKSAGETRVTVNGRNWGLIDVGRGLPVLFLPGTLGRADIFWNQIGALSDCRVLSLSYPASGSLASWVEDIALILAQRGVEKCDVLGSSLGGYVASYFAAVHPERVSHLFAANTLATTAGIDRQPPYSLDLASAPIAQLRCGFAKSMEAWKETYPEQSDLVDFLLNESGHRIADEEMRARLLALKEAPPLPAESRPAAETTLIESDDDPLVPSALRETVQARFKGSAVFRFSWGGHFAYIMRPQLYTGLIRGRLGLGPMPDEWANGVA